MQMTKTKDEFAKFRLDVLAKAFIVGAIVVVVALIFKQGLFSLGYLMGLLVSISNFSNMYSSIRALSNKQVEGIRLYLGLKYILFYLVLAFVLFVSFWKDVSMFIGVIAGFLSIKVVLIADIFLNKWKPHN